MPTGYTAPVMDGEITEVKDFARTCARAFGAFIHQRDERGDAPPRMPELDDSFYVKRLAEAKAELARWQGLSEEAKYAEWSEYVREQTVSLHKSMAKSAEKRARYENMLVQVHAIDVPAQLQNFKNFMVEQLEESIKFDCGDGRFERDYYKVLTFPEWCAMHDKSVLRDVTYYDEELRKERQRHAERIEYINLMIETFGFEVEK